MIFFESYRDFIPDFSSFQESLKYPLPTHLRINLLKTEPLDLVTRLEAQGISVRRISDEDETLLLAPELTSPGNLLEYVQGHIHPQALTSCLVSIALHPKPDSLVLDMCAAPGGKTAHLAQIMGQAGLIIANELYPSRQIPLAHTLGRLGVLNSVLTGYQAQEFPLKQPLDFVLADAPCTGEGRFRAITGMTGPRGGRGRARLVDVQRKILLRGFDLLQDGGKMVYATCTYHPEENEGPVNFLLENRPAELLPIDVGFMYVSGLTEWKGRRYDSRLHRAARFYPHHVNSVGFFMAKIGRQA
jgi:16S rRNA C967 or C1407 C5-methylase (RsmB/RsmF family)